MEKKRKWTEQDNETLIVLHESSQYYKELYERVGKFYRTMNKILGLTCIITSSVSTSIFWIDTGQNRIQYLNNSGNDYDESDNDILLKTLLGIMLFSTVFQNIISFIDTSNDYLETSAAYRKIQFKIEAIGDIHPLRRKGGPKKALPNLRDATNKLSQDSNDINSCLKWLFHDKNNVISYMREKHNKYGKEDISDEEYSGDYNNFAVDEVELSYIQT